MRIFIRYLFQTIFVGWKLCLQQSAFHNSISRITYYLVGFGGSSYFSADNNWCSGPSYLFDIRCYFGMPLIGIIPFGVLLSLCAINVRFQVISFGFQVTSSGFRVAFSLDFSLTEFTIPAG